MRYAVCPLRRKPAGGYCGLGKAFFEFIENSDEYGYVRLEVEHDNKRALKLYQSLGYADANYLSLYKKTKAE